MNISMGRMHTATVSDRTIAPFKSLDIETTPAQVSIKNNPAELTVQTYEPIMDINWERVWDSIGLQRPNSLMQSISSHNISEYTQDVSRTVSEGMQVARSVASPGKNVYAEIATNRYMQDHAVETVVALMPQEGPDISIKVYSPDIKVNVNIPVINVEFPTIKIMLKPVAANHSLAIDQLV